MKKFLVLSILAVLVIALVIRLMDDKEYGVDNLVENSSSVQTHEIDEKPLDNKTDISGNPQQIARDPASLELSKLTVPKPDQVLFRAGYTVSYNSNTRNPNWVAWHLTKEHTNGDWKKDGIPYMVDTDIEGPRQETEDWYGRDPEIDHGHMCPAGDNKWSRDAMTQSYLLSNICPQNKNLNRGEWEYLEGRCRGWARHFGDIYIVTGPIFLTDGYRKLGNSDVGVPDAFFKVILCMNKKPKALGFIYPNEETSNKMRDCVTTVDEVERVTGIDFFYNLPDEIEAMVESVSDIDKW